ncbi:putative cupin superfamily protein [Elusimicrobium simillimum]|uniref:cupin domain-containing protein n=1 Tax=Elusimicrobium simillimum TaxID=3143438 RepID=UPI003C6FBA63
MKELKVQNYKDIKGVEMGQDGNKFTYKALFPREEAGQCTAGFVEVEPGSFAFGYHYHELNEEIFYIISGTGIVRTIDGDVAVKAGDAVTFPTGEKGAHVIRNASDTEKLVYLDFDTNNPLEVAHFPDAKKIMVVGPHTNGMYDVK